jgi:outer membrane scaffolding protein for murein synthesis (MipA/OmpV family)
MPYFTARNYSELRRVTCRGCFALISALLWPASLLADGWIDYIRNYDLNEYALGLSTTVSTNPYVGSADSVFAYPYLTTFTTNMLTDDWLVLSDGDVGFRRIGQSGWIFGAVGRINTLGFGTDKGEELAGMEDRQWAIEIAPTIGYRGWPVQLELKPYWEATGRHCGFNSDFLVSLPIEHARGWITPQIRLTYQDEKYTSYYFGVHENEVSAGRPLYEPGASTSISARLHWGYQVSEKWLLSGRFGYEWLGNEIADSPIVEEESLWSVNLGVAYNADIFRSHEGNDSTNIKPGFEIRASLLRDSIHTEVIRNASNGAAGEPIDLEDILSISDDASIGQLEAIWRIKRFHRMNFGYFDVFRKTTATLEEDVSFGDEDFLAGSEVTAKVESQIAYASYTYLLMSDSQKELGVSAGLHYSKFAASIESNTTGQRETTQVSAPLPLIGASGSVSLGPRTTLGLQIQLFRLRADHLQGRLDQINLGIQHTFMNRVSGGIGYQLFDMRLDSDHNDLNGTVHVRHHGPYLFLGANFF